MNALHVGILPIFSYVILKKNFALLEYSYFDKKYGALYGNLSLYRPSTITFLSILCLQRFFFALSSVFLQQTSIGTTIPYFLLSLTYTSLIFHQKPMSSRLYNFLERTNNCFVILTAYFLLVCTDWLYLEPEVVRYKLGFLFNNCVIIIIVVNFIIIIYKSTQSVCFDYKKKQYHNRWKSSLLKNMGKKY